MWPGAKAGKDHNDDATTDPMASGCISPSNVKQVLLELYCVFCAEG